MARRIGLPAHIREELPLRAQAGLGHDPEAATRVGGRTVPANLAVKVRPSAEMRAMITAVTAYLDELGATHIDVGKDTRRQDLPGAVTIRWRGAVEPAVVAERFAVSRAEDGTPRIPSWLSLCADQSWDLRWQPAILTSAA